jgi:glucose/arabinose dehydrogenase
VLLALLGTGLLAGCGSPDDEDQPTVPLPTDAPTGDAKTASPSDRASADSDPRVVGTIASGLEVPWGLAFLPDGTALVTERDSGRVLSIQDGEVTEVGTVPEAAPAGESGLLGIAVSPSYAENHEVFLYVTTDEDNRILRTTYDGKRLGDLDVILDGIPNDFIHDGGRLAFGPDGYLYASTGETGNADLAQDRSSLGGKILRITTDGEPAPGNPFQDSPIWTWGHRNVQGLAFDDRDRLWASEFGASDWDELNLIVKGANYGWPFVEGTGGNAKYAEPRVVWKTSEASPSGLAFADGHLWLASLKGERLWRVDVDGTDASNPTDFFVGEYGRLRTVVVAPNGNLWVTTSNRDGRGDPAEVDDRILEIRAG